MTVRRGILIALAALTVALAGCTPAPPSAAPGATTAAPPAATPTVETTVSSDASASAAASTASGNSAIDSARRPSDTEMVAAAKRLAKESGAIQVVGARFGDAARDSKGRWWAEVDILNDLDGAIVVIYEDAGVWKLFGAGTGLEPSDLPPDVKLKF
jgi:hypothetical protein